MSRVVELSEVNCTGPKKLIEVALPLDDINAASAREKSIRHGHPSTLHLWWAHRPLAAARAVLFAQLVNDPGGERGYGAYRGQTKADAQRERDRLFDIIRELVKWENTNKEEVLEKARAEIRKSWAETCKITSEDPNKLPPFYDPFAGGGSIPLEAQRLGLEAHASDLNPVAVLINKAMIEIPPKFAGRAPVGPIPKGEKQTRTLEDWSGARGLAEDVRRYGAWMREEAEKRIGHLYPKVDLPKEHGGGKATVIAWLWARTVASPNPAYSGVHVPLISSFFLSTKNGKEAWIEPKVEGNSYQFAIRTGICTDRETVKAGTKLGRGANFRCLLSGSPISPDYIKAEGKAGRMAAKLMAIVVEGKGSRIYLEPMPEQESIAQSAKPAWLPEFELSKHPQYIGTLGYGFTKFSQLFTSRQLVALTTFSDLVIEAREQVITDAKAAGWSDDATGLNDGGNEAIAYGDAVATYLSLGVSRLSDICNSLCMWENTKTQVRHLFTRQAIPMLWDFAEPNIFADAAGDFGVSLNNLAKVIDKIHTRSIGFCIQADARRQTIGVSKIVSTDPPYYDNVPYADLSDFFYVWLHRSLRPLFPQLFSTLLTPKTDELVADVKRHLGKEKAQAFFMEGMSNVIHNMAENGHPAFPVTIYYAFKQSDSGGGGTASTGWKTLFRSCDPCWLFNHWHMATAN